MGRWYILRHGETEWNAQGRVQGHTDVPLSEMGRRQARMAARRLSGVHFDAAYSSDSSRSAETARLILGERDVHLRTMTKLREYNKGIFEGLTAQETSTRYPDMYAASLEMDLDFAPTGGESTRQTTIRLAELVSEIKPRHLNDDVLIVGHGGSLRALLVALMDLPLEANWRFFLANCGLSMVDTYTDNAVMRLFNDTSHLDGIAAG